MKTDSVPSDSGGFVASLESVRGLAALCVAITHCMFLATFARGPDVTPQSIPFAYHLTGWIFDGFQAVVIFFVLSGYVLALSLEKQRSGSFVRTYFKFILRRLLRIYPAHIAVMAGPVLLLILVAHNLPPPDPQLARQTPLPHWWFDGTFFAHPNPRIFLKTVLLQSNDYNWITWTLRVEVLAGFWMPFLALIARKTRYDADIAMLALLVAAALVLTPGQPASVLYYLPAFYAGCLVRTRGPAMASWIGQWRYGSASCLVLAKAATITLMISVKISSLRLDYIMANVLFAFLIIIIITYAPPAPVTRLLQLPIMRDLGRVSFSFYLLHWPILCLISHVIASCATVALVNEWRQAFVAVSVATIPASYLLAKLTWSWVEVPFVRISRKLTDTSQGGGVKRIAPDGG